MTTITWKDVYVRVKLKNGDTKVILRNVTGHVKPGSLLAIMGASGCGKTTLLNQISQRNMQGLDCDGQIEFNGRAAGPWVSNIMAYIQQDDLFIGTLTVREHLIFQSWVRMNKEGRKQRVAQVIEELGLTKCADTAIGWPGGLKGISGGERKRLAFATEILTDPPVLLVDEPTSGLDSFMASSVVAVLADMARQGKTILATIHQPSSETFALFSELCLLGDGRVAYFGAQQCALHFFAAQDETCPNNYNPADFYVNVLADKEKAIKMCDSFAEGVRDGQNGNEVEIPPEVLSVPIKETYRATWMVQFLALTWRAWKALLREPLITSVRTIQSIAIALLLGAIYFGQNEDQYGIMNLNGALFLLITNMTFQNAFAVINTFCAELPIFVRENNDGIYSVSAYFLSKTIAELPTFIVVPVLFTAIFYWMVRLHETAECFFVCLGVAVLIALVACSYGYFVSCISPSVTVALGLGPSVIVPMLIFGGYFLNNKTVPDYFIWLKYISWFFYGNEIMVINQWRYVGSIECPPNITIPCYPNGAAIIAANGFDEDNVWRDAGVLVAMTIGFRVLAYMALAFRSRTSR